MAAVLNHSGGLKTIQEAIEVDGEHTDILCTWFTDRIMIVVTQYNKFGTLVDIKKEKAISKSITPTDQPRAQFTYSTKVLMGKDEPIWHVYGRQIAMAIMDDNDQSSRSVLLTIALKKHSPDILQCITKQINEMKSKEKP